MSPPIIWQNLRLITSPRPVPPYLLAVVEDAWENSWNSLLICSGVMPMPVSATDSVTSCGRSPVHGERRWLRCATFLITSDITKDDYRRVRLHRPGLAGTRPILALTDWL